MSGSPETPVTVTRPTVGAWTKSALYSVGNFFIRYPLAAAGTVVIVVGAVFLSFCGQNVQIGGVLSWLWGRMHPKDAPNAPVVTHAPPARVDDHGNVIAPGTVDDRGFVQVPVVLPIKDPGMLSDPTTLVVVHPDGKEVTIALPIGVKNSDVKQVVLVSPGVYQVANNDTGVDAGKVLEDITK